MRRVFKKGINTIFREKDLLPPLTVPQVRACIEINDKDTLQRSFLRLALVISTNYASTYKQDQDILGVAIVAMMEAVNRLNIDHPNPGGFVRKYIEGAILNYIKEDTTVKYSRYAKKELTFSRLIDDGDLSPEFLRLRTKYSEPSIIPQVLNHKMFTKTEKKIMQMRMDGYNDKEIADELKVTRAWVQNLRQSLRGRVDYILKG